MELHKFAQIGIINRITAVPSFALQTSPCMTYFLHKREKQFEISYVDYTTTRKLPESFNLCRCTLEYPTDWPTQYVPKEKKKVFDSVDFADYVDVLLDAKWNPQDYRQKPTLTPRKIEFSQSMDSKIFVAVLMASGSFHLFTRKGIEWAECCDIGTQHAKNVAPSTPATSYETFKISLDEAEIVTFDWLEPKGDEFPLIWVSKSGSVYSGAYNAVDRKLTIKKETLEFPNLSDLKVFSSESKDLYLIRASTTGTITLYRMKRNSQTLTPENTCDLWTDEDHISVGCVLVRFHDTGFRVFVVKGFFVIIFELDGQMTLQNTILQRFDGPFITGLQLVNNHQFLVTLVNNKILFGILKNGKVVTEVIKTEFDANYSCCGVTPTQNNAIWMFCLCASKAYDYTTLRTPERHIFARLSLLDPLEMVLQDPEKKISNHLIYFEMIRSTKSSTAKEYAKVTEKLNSSVNSEKIVYFLKILLFFAQINANPMDRESGRRVKRIQTTILGIEFHKTLQALLDFKYKHDEDQLRVIENIRIFLATQFEPDNSWRLDKFKTLFNETSEKAKVIAKVVSKEQCILCEHEIPDGKQSCVQFHEVQRCCYTNCQVPLMTVARCPICGMQSLDVESINRILGVNITRPVCPTCDAAIE